MAPKWLIRVCRHGYRVEWKGHPNTLGGWLHMDVSADDINYCDGSTEVVEVVPAADLASTAVEYASSASTRRRLEDALRETLDLCNSMREYAPTLSLEAHRRLRDSLALLGETAT